MDLSQVSTEELMKMRGLSAPVIPDVPVDEPTGIESVGRGFMDVAQGMKQGGMMLKDLINGGNETADYTRQKTDELNLYEKGRGPDAGMDWGRIGGNVLATAPAMAIPGGASASLPIRMLAGAGQGAASSAAMFTPEGQSKTAQTLIGTAIGGAIPLAVSGVKQLVGKTANSITGGAAAPAAGSLEGEIAIKLQQKGIDYNALTNEVKQSLLADAEKSLSMNGTLDDAMLANKATIESVGATPTKASVTRLPRDWQNEKNLRGIQNVGEGIVKREQTNAQAMIDYLSKIRRATDGTTSTALETGESAIKALKAQDAAKEAVVTKLYTAFRETGAQNAEVPATKIADELGRVADEIGTENIPGPVMSRLKEFGLLEGKQSKLLTVNEADKLNRLINNNNPGFGPQSLALGKLKQALNESLLEVPGDGSEALMKARGAAAQRFAEQRAGKGITAALDDVSPDRFVKKFVMDADVRDLRAMKTELVKSTQGAQALKDVRGHIVDNLLMKATGATSVDDVAGKAFSGSRFAKALDSIAPEKLHLLFSPDEITALRGLQKASKLLTEEVPFSDVNYSKTTAAMANLLQKIGSTPLLGELVSPILGVGKIGMDWVKDASLRKQVAEALVGSAVKAGERAIPQAPTYLERALPASAAAAITQPRQRTNN